MSISAISSTGSSSWAQALQGVNKKKQGMSDDMAEQMSANMISDYDSDQSGGLSITESTLSDDDFTTLDTDGDGSLTASELKTGLTSNNQSLSALMPPPPSGVGGGKMGEGMPEEIASKIADSLVSQYDTDSSGGLSATESTLSDDEFNGLDTDGDGILSTSELQSGLTSHNEALGKLMPEPPSGGMPPGSESSDSSEDSEDSTTLSKYATTQGLAAYRSTLTSTLIDSLSDSASFSAAA